MLRLVLLRSFFIPDVEYLADPEGLVGYVEEKVKLGNICLYCNGKGKTFHTYRALQQVGETSFTRSLYPDEGVKTRILSTLRL